MDGIASLSVLLHFFVCTLKNGVKNAPLYRCKQKFNAIGSVICSIMGKKLQTKSMSCLIANPYK